MQPAVDIEALNQQIYIESAFVETLLGETAKVIVGQDRMMERLLLGLLTKGHVLLEGLPGLAKTLAIKTLATAIKTGTQLEARLAQVASTPAKGKPANRGDQWHC